MACSSSGRIAVVGIACDLPSGSYSDKNLTYQDFFKFLQDRGEAYEVIPSDRLNIESWHGVGLGHIQVKQGSFLKDIDKFDNLEFGISHNDAALMAPVTRKLIETCFLALVDSGIDYRGRNVGCYTSGNNFDMSSISDPDEYMTASFAGYPSMVANRVSYHLDLLGPSLPTDTACSSTMTALHLAVSAIINKDCEAAVVSGCQLNHRFMDWVQYSRGGILSDDGKCKPFDASADGFARGEACVAIVVKPLEAALRDGDYVYATILSTAINNSGQAAPAGAPVAERQRDAMIEAYQRAGRKPEEVDYIELHATGTAKGDPTEANWAGEQFKRDSEVVVGSLKGNIGHTEIASLLASMAKVLHILDKEVVPPNVNFVTPNPAIRWKEYHLRVPTESLPLRTHEDRPSLISMASSGIGGANGHVLLEGAPKSVREAHSRIISNSQRPILLMASGLSPRTALAVSEQAAKVFIDPSCDRASLATVMGRRSRQTAWRTFKVVSSDSDSDIAFPAPVLCSRVAKPIIFLFSGQGPQHKDMGRELFNTFPGFRQSIEEMDEVHKRVTGKSLIVDYGLFTGDAKTPETWPISLILPSITIFQLALYDLFLSLGIRPDAVIGHSAGETAVLHACGGAPKAMAVELSIIRGQTFTVVEALGGTMAAISCSPEKTEELIRLALVPGLNEVVEIACYNSPTDTAIAGHKSAIERVIEKAKVHGILGRIIRTQVPIHSSMMEACQKEYTHRLEDLFRRYPGPHVPSVKTFSTFTGKRFDESFTADYFWQNTRGQVQFTQAMKSLSDIGAATFIEISPHPVLASYTSAMVEHSSVVLSSVRRPKSGQPLTEYTNILDLCGQLTINGHNCVDFAALNGTTSLQARHMLSSYPFAKKQFPLYPDTPGVAKQFAARNGPLNFKYLKINKDTHPIIAEHVIRGEPIMPAAGFLEMALEFGASTLMNVEMRSILSLSSDKPVPVQVTLEDSYWKVASNSFSKDGSHNPATARLHADGYLSFEPPVPGERIDLSAIRKRCSTFVSEGFYDTPDGAGMGPRFRRLINLTYGDGESLASINGLDDALRNDGNYVLHPAIIDACIQASTYKPFQGEFSPFVYFLPSGVQTVQLHQPSRVNCCPRFFYSYLKITEWGADSVLHDIVLTDSAGIPFCTMKGFRIAKHRITPPPNVSRAFDVVWRNLETSRDDDGGLFHPRSFVFNYHMGEEVDLQWLLSGMNASQSLDIWILASRGIDGSAAIGMLRAVRREYPVWNLRVVLFPETYPEDMWVQHLETLPRSFVDEPEIMVSDSGEFLVSRLEEVKRGHDSTRTADEETGPLDGLPHEVLVHISRKWNYVHTTLFFGTVAQPCDCPPSEGAHVVGFLGGDIQRNVLSLPPTHLVQVHPKYAEVAARILPHIQPFVNAVLALGPSTFRSSKYAQSLRILVTHADTPMGMSLKAILADQQVPFLEIGQGARLSELSQLGVGHFDVIISEYEDSSYIQILQTLLRARRGRLYLTGSLNDLIVKDPCTVQDALHLVMTWLDKRSFVLGDLPLLESPHISQQNVLQSNRAKYRPDRTYLVLGGIGSLGLHIAEYLYKHGARHVVLTSRSGYKAISRSQNRLLRNMAAHLEKFADLDLQYTAVDSLSKHAMTVLTQSLTFPLAGCFILTAVLDDSTFLNISEESFERSRAAKTGVLRMLSETVDVSALDFLVAFSSVSGTIGNSGQSNYGAANTALEEAIDSIPNAFSFICPGIVDSSLMLGTGSADQNRVLRTGIPWSMSAEDMILWLDDALKLFFSGRKVSRYVPDLEWDIVAQAHGVPKLAKHLTTQVEDEDTGASTQIDHKQVIREIVQQTLNVPASDFEDNIPLTSYGIDSISASRVSFLLRRFVDITQIQLLADISLNDILHKMEDDSNSRSTESVPTSKKTGKQAKALGPSAMLESQLTRLSDLPDVTQYDQPLLDAVLVTGTTGSLGCNILNQLLCLDDVSHVYAFNRGNSGMTAMERQALSFSAQGLPVTLLSSSKLTVLEGDMSTTNFGLEDSIYEELSARVTHVIHAAWKVNFGAPVSEFEDLIGGTTNLIRFCSLSNSTLSFISTIGIYLGMHSPDGLPEAPIVSHEDAKLPGGYLESKWIAERLVQISSENRKIQANVIRVGLITGSSNGIWDVSHWLPTLVESGSHVGCLPEGDGVASWVPIDLAATSIIDSRAAMNETIHIVHPRPVPWNSLIVPIAEDLQLPLVPFREWLSRLEHLNALSSSSRQKIPAFALLDFYREGARNLATQAIPESMGMLPVVAFKRGTSSSKTLSDPAVPQLGAPHVKAWLKYWKDIGFLR
ncbi:hypothetical protein VNI00_011871 [Paramarasmius palmivorus]|uniref:Polyketide synthase n=1 Tax=Paramarasmius palmivorus TaxID=297713 RepID=A0AAW0C7H5_9AGAR